MNLAFSLKPCRTTFKGKAFTLVEVLVSIAVLLLILALLAQVINNTNMVTSVSSKQIECASQARISLDRIAMDLNSRAEGGGATIIVSKGTGSSDGLCFIAYSRTSDRGSSPATSDTRIGIFGFSEALQMDPVLNSNVPMLLWGDGVLTWSAQTGSVTQVDSDLTRALQRAASDLPVAYSGSAGGNMLNWVPLGTGIVRFEISFLLDNGTVAAVPPTDKNYSLSAPLYAIALSASSSSDPNQRYVKALIVGVAALDSQTRQSLVANNGFQTLNNNLPDVSGTSLPLEFWDPLPALWIKNKTFPPPVAQAIRFYQRTYFL